METGGNKPKRPDWRYAQELLVRGELLKVRLNSKYSAVKSEDANRSTWLEAEFSTEIYDIYSAFAATGKMRAKKGDERWTILENCIVRDGKPADILMMKDFAELLHMNENMISDSRLLRDECRASIDGVCHMLVGLGLMKGSEEGDMVLRAEKNAAERKKRGEEDGLSKAQQQRPIEAAKRRNAVIGPKQRFAQYTKVPDEIPEKTEKIRHIAEHFGYWLPEEKDEDERKKQIQRAEHAARSMSGIDAGRNDLLGMYLDLPPDRIPTLCEPKRSLSHNANKLHMIIAACGCTDGTKEIERAYHAFGLHPAGLCDKKRAHLPKNRRPFVLADQVTLTAIEYFRPLIESMSKMTRSSSGAAVFWTLMGALLNTYEGEPFGRLRLRLNNELIYKGDDKQKEIFEEYFEERQLLPDDAQMRRMMQSAIADQDRKSPRKLIGDDFLGILRDEKRTLAMVQSLYDEAEAVVPKVEQADGETGSYVKEIHDELYRQLKQALDHPEQWRREILQKLQSEDSVQTLAILAQMVFGHGESWVNALLKKAEGTDDGQVMACFASTPMERMFAFGQAQCPCLEDDEVRRLGMILGALFYKEWVGRAEDREFHLECVNARAMAVWGFAAAEVLCSKESEAKPAGYAHAVCMTAMANLPLKLDVDSFEMRSACVGSLFRKRNVLLSAMKKMCREAGLQAQREGHVTIEDALQAEAVEAAWKAVLEGRSPEGGERERDEQREADLERAERQLETDAAFE